MPEHTSILGINTSHDRAACLVVDGTPVACIAEERLDRRKHSVQPSPDGSYLCTIPQRAVRYCLDEADIELGDVDRIVVSSSVVYHPVHKIRNLTLDDVLDQLPGVDPGRVEILNHHVAHAAGAYFSSGFDEAAVMVVDGGGNIVGTGQTGMNNMPPVEHTTLFHAEGGRVRQLAKVCAKPHTLNSLGAFYHLATIFAGFGQYNEGKTMGLAPYGDTTLLPALDGAIRVLPDGTYDIDPALQPYDRWSRFFKRAFKKRFGEPRAPGSELRQIDKDLAFAFQDALERALIDMAARLYERTGSKNLCIAGGVGLNSVANKKILDETPFENVFIVPCAADDGCALGGALWGWHRQEPAPRRYTMRHAYLGRGYSDDEIEAALGEKPGWVEWKRSGDVARETAQHVADGKIVGWFQGGSETGPRALGHRSILCDSRRAEMVDILNARVKHREAFRPFAPAVLLEHAGEYFDLPRESPYMLLIAEVLQPEAIPAVTHVDVTGRVQTVTREDNGAYHALIEAFHEITGVPVILNTSFNVAGEPIVETPADALNCFLDTRIDVLVLGDYVVTKTSAMLVDLAADLKRQVELGQALIRKQDLELESIRGSVGWRIVTALNRLRRPFSRGPGGVGFM